MCRAATVGGKEVWWGKTHELVVWRGTLDVVEVMNWQGGMLGEWVTWDVLRCWQVGWRRPLSGEWFWLGVSWSNIEWCHWPYSKPSRTGYLSFLTLTNIVTHGYSQCLPCRPRLGWLVCRFLGNHADTNMHRILGCLSNCRYSLLPRSCGYCGDTRQHLKN